MIQTLPVLIRSTFPTPPEPLTPLANPLHPQQELVQRITLLAEMCVRAGGSASGSQIFMMANEAYHRQNIAAVLQDAQIQTSWARRCVAPIVKSFVASTTENFCTVFQQDLMSFFKGFLDCLDTLLITLDQLSLPIYAALKDFKPEGTATLEEHLRPQCPDLFHAYDALAGLYREVKDFNRRGHLSLDAHLRTRCPELFILYDAFKSFDSRGAISLKEHLQAHCPTKLRLFMQEPFLDHFITLCCLYDKRPKTFIKLIIKSLHLVLKAQYFCLKAVFAAFKRASCIAFANHGPVSLLNLPLRLFVLPLVIPVMLGTGLIYRTSLVTFFSDLRQDITNTLGSPEGRSEIIQQHIVSLLEHNISGLDDPVVSTEISPSDPLPLRLPPADIRIAQRVCATAIALYAPSFHRVPLLTATIERLAQSCAMSALRLLYRGLSTPHLVSNTAFSWINRGLGVPGYPGKWESAELRDGSVERLIALKQYYQQKSLIRDTAYPKYTALQQLTLALDFLEVDVEGVIKGGDPHLLAQLTTLETYYYRALGALKVQDLLYNASLESALPRIRQLELLAQKTFRSSRSLLEKSTYSISEIKEELIEKTTALKEEITATEHWVKNYLSLPDNPTAPSPISSAITARLDGFLQSVQNHIKHSPRFSQRKSTQMFNPLRQALVIVGTAFAGDYPIPLDWSTANTHLADQHLRSLMPLYTTYQDQTKALNKALRKQHALLAARAIFSRQLNTLESYKKARDDFERLLPTHPIFAEISTAGGWRVAVQRLEAARTQAQHNTVLDSLNQTFIQVKQALWLGRYSALQQEIETLTQARKTSFFGMQKAATDLQGLYAPPFVYRVLEPRTMAATIAGSSLAKTILGWRAWAATKLGAATGLTA